jgi:hypothetical protein
VFSENVSSSYLCFGFDEKKCPDALDNEAGAYAFSTFKSLVQTLAKRGAGSIVEALYTLFQSPKTCLLLAKPQSSGH